MGERHKHADLIIAWANGEQIQYYDDLIERWIDIDKPNWLQNTEYRIKPQYNTLNTIDNSTLSEIKVLYTPDKQLSATILDTNFKGEYKNLTILAKVNMYNTDQLILINRYTGTYKFLDDIFCAESYFVYFPE